MMWMPVAPLSLPDLAILMAMLAVAIVMFSGGDDGES